jgi:hypothetical protein
VGVIASREIHNLVNRYERSESYESISLAWSASGRRIIGERQKVGVERRESHGVIEDLGGSFTLDREGTLLQGGAPAIPASQHQFRFKKSAFRDDEAIVQERDKRQRARHEHFAQLLACASQYLLQGQIWCGGAPRPADVRPSLATQDR